MFIPPEEARTGTSKSFLCAYVLCILLTAAAYLMVSHHIMSGWSQVLTISGCGVLQILIQLILFVHLGIESKPRWNLIAFLFAILIAVIVIIGSVWIMSALDYRMMGDG